MKENEKEKTIHDDLKQQFLNRINSDGVASTGNLYKQGSVEYFKNMRKQSTGVDTRRLITHCGEYTTGKEKKQNEILNKQDVFLERVGDARHHATVG